MGTGSEVEAKLRRRDSGLNDGKQTDWKGRGGSSSEPRSVWNFGAKKEVGAGMRAWRCCNADTEKRRAWREHELAGWTSAPRDAVRAAAAMAEDAIDLFEEMYFIERCHCQDQVAACGNHVRVWPPLIVRQLLRKFVSSLSNKLRLCQP